MSTGKGVRTREHEKKPGEEQKHRLTTEQPTCQPTNRAKIQSKIVQKMGKNCPFSSAKHPIKTNKIDQINNIYVLRQTQATPTELPAAIMEK